MDKKYCEDMVQKIADVSEDDESAHSHEDDLYHEFVRFVAENADNDIAEMAKEILKTEEFDFARWCA